MKDLRNLIKTLRAFKLLIRISLIALALLIILFSVVHVYVMLRGPAMIQKGIEELSKRKVSIGNFDVRPFLRLEIRNLCIEGLGKIENVSIAPSVIRLLTGRLGFNEVRIIGPEFTYEKVLAEVTKPLTESESLTSIPQASPDTESLPKPAVSSAVKHPRLRRNLELVFKRIIIKNGKLKFVDHTAGENPITIIVKDLLFNLTNLYIPTRSAVSNFELKARIPWGEEGKKEGSVEAGGWLDLYKKDMGATLKIEDINGIYLYPYYSQWVDLEKARIKEAKLNFTSSIHSLNNNLTADCHLELTDIVFKPRLPDEQAEKAEKIATAVLSIFKALNQGKIVLDFTFKTKMDRPQFGFSDIKMAFEEKIAQGTKSNKIDPVTILMLPAKFLEGTVKGAADVSKALISGTFAVGNEFIKALGDSFKRDKEE